MTKTNTQHIRYDNDPYRPLPPCQAGGRNHRWVMPEGYEGKTRPAPPGSRCAKCGLVKPKPYKGTKRKAYGRHHDWTEPLECGLIQVCRRCGTTRYVAINSVSVGQDPEVDLGTILSSGYNQHSGSTLRLRKCEKHSWTGDDSPREVICQTCGIYRFELEQAKTGEKSRK